MDNAPSTPPAAKPTAAPVQYRCTVIAEVVRIGKLDCGQGHKIQLPEAEAKALEAIKAVRIDGI